MNKKLMLSAVLAVFMVGTLSAQENNKNNRDDEHGSDYSGNNTATAMHDVNYGGINPSLASKPNILYIAPIQFTENGVGLSIGYEKAIDKEGIVAYNLPLIATFNLANHNNGVDKQDAMFYFSPGLKFYPTGSFGKSKYAIGPSLVVGAGQRTDFYDTYNPNGGYIISNYVTHSKFLLGVMITNSLNINPTPNVYMGIDLGLGFTYINRWNGDNQGMGGIIQGGFKIGYRL